MNTSMNAVSLPEHMKRPGVQPVPVRDWVGFVPVALHMVGYPLWAAFFLLFNPYSDSLWQALLLLALPLSLLLPAVP